MSLDNTNRRAYLGGVTAALTGLSGCNLLDGDSETGTSTSDVDAPQNTESTARDTVSDTPVAQQAAQYFDDAGELIAPVNNETVTTEAVSQNVATGTELVAFDDDGTATIVDGRSRAVVYSGDDIGQLINELQTDYAEGVHLHLMDMFEYSTGIEISTSMKLTGERTASDLNREAAYAAPVDPVGLRFTGSGVAVQCHNGETPVQGLHVEDLYVHAESGTVAFKVWGETAGSSYSPWVDSVFHNIVTKGGSEAGIELHGSMFNCTFGNLRAFASEGHGIWLHRGEGGGNPGLSTFNLLRAKYCGGDGVRAEAIGLSVIDRIYANFCAGRGVYLGSNGGGNVYHRIFGEVNEGPDVEITELLGGRIERVYGRGGEPAPDSLDYEGPAVRIGLFKGSIGNVLAQVGDIEVVGMRQGSEIEWLSAQDGAGLVIDSEQIFDSQIHKIETDGSDKPGFNEATLTDDNETGTVRFSFDTRFNQPPTLSFGRRGGGIEDVRYARTSADGQFFAADIDIAESGGTVDVKAELSGRF